ncbi:MAG TPA: AAA family ATPase [Dehalococcoidia bacterium]|nr:AAA family ATPase [Dehalococcoidia bacterium]
MKLIVLHGPPGVGKLTVGRELATLTGYGLFHNHLTIDLVHTLFEFGTAPFQELRERIWLDVLGRAADEGVSGVIFTLVFEPTLLPGFYDRLRERIETAGGSLRPFELRCSIEENQRRIVQADRAAFLKSTDAGSLGGALRQHRYDAPAGMPDNVVIDTTALSAIETALLVQEIHEAGS